MSLNKFFTPTFLKLLLTIAFFFPLLSWHPFYYPGYSVYRSQVFLPNSSQSNETQTIKKWCNKQGCVEEIVDSRRTGVLLYILPIISSYLLACFLIVILRKIKGKPVPSSKKTNAISVLLKIAILLFAFAISLGIWISVGF